LFANLQVIMYGLIARGGIKITKILWGGGIVAFVGIWIMSIDKVFQLVLWLILITFVILLLLLIFGFNNRQEKSK
jgi:hypothetical protein